jgi:hypothetical protein
VKFSNGSINISSDPLGGYIFLTYSTGHTRSVSMNDREKVIQMLAKVDDKFALGVYKKVYNIAEKEIEERKKAIKPHEEKK